MIEWRWSLNSLLRRQFCIHVFWLITLIVRLLIRTNVKTELQKWTQRLVLTLGHLHISPCIAGVTTTTIFLSKRTLWASEQPLVTELNWGLEKNFSFPNMVIAVQRFTQPVFPTNSIWITFSNLLSSLLIYQNKHMIFNLNYWKMQLVSFLTKCNLFTFTVRWYDWMMEIII